MHLPQSFYIIFGSVVLSLIILIDGFVCENLVWAVLYYEMEDRMLYLAKTHKCS